MEGLLVLTLVVLGLLAVIASRLVSVPALLSGLGDWQVHRCLRRRLPASHYTVLRDLFLPYRGGAVHIDDLVVSPYGIFVIETQKLSGWIFGSVRDATWTRVTRRAESVFPNPLHHNDERIKALEALLLLRRPLYHSVVVFTGDARFETPLPANVTQLGGLPLYLQARTQPVIDFDEIPGLLARIDAVRLMAAPRPPRARQLRAWAAQGRFAETQGR